MPRRPPGCALSCLAPTSRRRQRTRWTTGRSFRSTADPVSCTSVGPPCPRGAAARRSRTQAWENSTVDKCRQRSCAKRPVCRAVLLMVALATGALHAHAHAHAGVSGSIREGCRSTRAPTRAYETNPGAGLEYRFDPEWAVGFGQYENPVLSREPLSRWRTGRQWTTGASAGAHRRVSSPDTAEKKYGLAWTGGAQLVLPDRWITRGAASPCR